MQEDKSVKNPISNQEHSDQLRRLERELEGTWHDLSDQRLAGVLLTLLRRGNIRYVWSLRDRSWRKLFSVVEPPEDSDDLLNSVHGDLMAWAVLSAVLEGLVHFDTAVVRGQRRLVFSGTGAMPRIN